MYHLLGTGKRKQDFYVFFSMFFLCKVDSNHSDVKSILKK